MKIFSADLKIYFWIVLIISFDIKSDISVNELDLKEVFKSGRSLISLDNGLHYLEAVSYTHLTLPTICSV